MSVSPLELYLLAPHIMAGVPDVREMLPVHRRLMMHGTVLILGVPLPSQGCPAAQQSI